MTIILLIIGFFIFIRALGWYINPHTWTYRNPYDRTCKVCGQHEVLHEYYGEPGNLRWDVFKEGSGH